MAEEVLGEHVAEGSENFAEQLSEPAQQLGSELCCAYCKGHIQVGQEDLITCPGCQTLGHKGCWEELRGRPCFNLGCRGTQAAPAAERRMSHLGKALLLIMLGFAVTTIMMVFSAETARDSHPRTVQAAENNQAKKMDNVFSKMAQERKAVENLKRRLSFIKVHPNASLQYERFISEEVMRYGDIISLLETLHKKGIGVVFSLHKETPCFPSPCFSVGTFYLSNQSRANGIRGEMRSLMENPDAN